MHWSEELASGGIAATTGIFPSGTRHCNGRVGSRELLPSSSQISLNSLKHLISCSRSLEIPCTCPSSHHWQVRCPKTAKDSFHSPTTWRSPIRAWIKKRHC